MPIYVPNGLPAIERLREENITVLTTSDIAKLGHAPLQVVLLNLMPDKQETETNFIRVLSNTPLHVELTLMRIKSYTPKHTPAEYMDAFYTDLSQMRDKHYDGLIVTGAPLDFVDFEDVIYWKEMTEIIDWAQARVSSTFYVCWGGMAKLYYSHGIDKYPLGKKLSGVFEHRLLHPQHPLFRGFDSVFHAPQSRHIETRKEDVAKTPGLTLLAESEAVGVFIIMEENGRDFIILGHPEYTPHTLDREYRRDVGKGMSVPVPANYYRDNDPQNEVEVRWRAHGNLLYSNWLTYFVAPKEATNT